MNRHPLNPLLRPTDLSPSHPELTVIGVFNAGAVLFKGQVLLLLRVAETALKDHQIGIPLMNRHNEITIKLLNPKDDHEFDYSDSRFVAYKKANQNGRVAYLTSLSHLRVARSNDGVHFTIDETPLLPEGLYENFGIEDPRITQIGDTFHIVYTSVSSRGVSVSKMTTKDFIHFERNGVIFPPENKDVVLFPEKINGRYVAYHRPVPFGIGGLNIWSATSDNLRDWGNHQCLARADDFGYLNGRIGAGAPPIKTSLGWLHIFHGADAKHRYELSAFITDLKDHTLITHFLKHPLLKPEAPYELTGFFDHVVFSCGVVLKDDIVYIYYGAADSTLALAHIPMTDLLGDMLPYEYID
jgi:predicted GH43/DUF377 family glycosyl hydrolase